MYSVSQREPQVCSLRVSEVITHILNFLLDMGILNVKKPSEGTSDTGAAGPGSSTSATGEPSCKDDDLSDNTLKPIELFLAAVVR